MWKQQIREESGEGSTVDGTASDESDSNNNKNNKGKGRKDKVKGNDTGNGTVIIEHQTPAPKNTDTAITTTAAGVQEALFSPSAEPSVVDPTELTQVVVEHAATTVPATPAAVSAIIDEAASTNAPGDDSVPSSQPSSGRSTPKSKKKKNKKKN